MPGKLLATYLFTQESSWFDKPYSPHIREFFCYLLHNLPLWVTNEDVLSAPIKAISGAVAGDSKLQDRGVAHYLLPLLFSLVSLPFSLYFCLLVFNQKVQKNSCLVSSLFALLLLAWVLLRIPSSVTLQVTTIVTLYALLLLHLPPRQFLVLKLNLLCSILS